MLSFRARLRPLSRSLFRQVDQSCVLNRLCFRSSKLLTLGKTSRQNDLLFIKHFSSIEKPLLSTVNDPGCVSTTQVEQGNGFRIERRCKHAVLEDDSDFQETVFPASSLEEYVNHLRQCSALPISNRDFSQTSAENVAKYIYEHVPTMGREDFRKTCNAIAEPLSKFSDDDILKITKVLYSFSLQGGNGYTFWHVLDNELLTRYSNYANDSTKMDFFVKITDVLYWSNFLDRSMFAEKFLERSISSRQLRYPHGLQILFYASCESWSWRSKVNVKHLIDFLDSIKSKCKLPTFLVAVQCFSVLHHLARSQSSARTVRVPDELQNFLLLKAIENIESEHILKPIAQIFYVCSVRRLPKNLLSSLLNKIEKYDQPLNFLVVHYLLHVMNKCGVNNNKLVAKLVRSVDLNTANPDIICSMLLNLYGELGPYGVASLAKQASRCFEKGDIPFYPEGRLLQMFVVLMDLGIKLFSLWELTIQGNVLVPNFTQGRSLHHDYNSNCNGLQLVADDCIEVNCPFYKGSRLSDPLRMQLYFENNCKSNVDTNHPFYSIFQSLQHLTGGNVVSAHVLPGFCSPGLADLIVCINSKNVFSKPHHIKNIHPWRVKKLPKTTQHDLMYLVVWCCPPGWPAYFVRLKDSTLKKLGYLSLQLDAETHNLPDEFLVEEIFSFTSNYRKERYC